MYGCTAPTRSFRARVRSIGLEIGERTANSTYFRVDDAGVWTFPSAGAPFLLLTTNGAAVSTLIGPNEEEQWRRQSGQCQKGSTQ